MSASLVGSEMCIRDRFHAKQPCPQHGICKSRGPAFQRRAPEALRFAGCPVSYTHLTLPTICSV
eukprot:13698527-Alexandrium_andersonii.AAC.1